MSLTHRCPECKTPISYTADMAGELTACPGCQELVALPAKGSTGKSAPGPMPTMGPLPVPGTGPIPLPKTGPAAPPPVPRTGQGNAPSIPKTTMNEPPPMPRKSSKASAPPISPTQAVQAPGDEFSDLDRLSKRRSRDREEEPQSSNAGLFIAIGVGGFLLVAGAIAVAVVLMMPGGDGKDKQAKEGAKPKDDDKPVVDKDGAPKADGKPKMDNAVVKEGPPKKDGNEKVNPVEVPAKPKMNVELARQRALQSAAWIVSEGQQVSATGVLIDATNHLVLTSNHPFSQGGAVRVYFPVRDKDGKLIDDPGTYLKTPGIAGRVLKQAPEADLALIQLDAPPVGVQEALPEPTGTPEKGDQVLAMRAIGLVAEGGGKLWQAAAATTVSRIDPKRTGEVLGKKIEAQCMEVEEDAARENGDNGGPVMNAKGLLVGIVSVLKPEKPGGATYMDLKEANVKLGLRRGEGIALQAGKEDLPRLLVALNGADAKAQRDAVRALGTMGADANGSHHARPAVPSLMRLWDKADAALAADVEKTLNQIGRPDATDIDVLREALKGERREGKLFALACLRQMGEEDGPKQRGKSTDKALPEVFRVCGDKEFAVRATALATLPLITIAEQKGVISALLRGIKDEQQRVRLAALDGLGKLGRPVRGEVIEELIGAVGDKDELVAARAMEAINEVHPLSAPDVPPAKRAGMRPVGEGDMDVLRRALKHDQPRVKRFVASELFYLGRKAVAAMPELSESIKDPDADVRVASLRVLQALGSDAASATEGLIKLLKDADARVRAGAALTLGAIGSQPGSFPALLERLTDTDLDVRRASGKALQDIKKPVAGDVAAVIKLLEHDDVVIRKFAASGVGALEKASKPAWPTLVKLATRDKSLEVRLTAISALGGGEAEAQAHAPALAAALREKVVAGPEDKQLLEKFAEAPEASDPTGPADKDLIKRGLLLSTVWVADVRWGNRVAATGFIVDAKNRLIVTSYRIFRSRGQQVHLFPPTAPKGKDADDIQPGAPGMGRVIDGDRNRDIAVIAVPALPPKARGLTFASGDPKSGEEASSMGTTGADSHGVGRPFTFLSAKVDRAGKLDIRDRGRAFTGKLIEFNGALHVKDAGGPIVNSRLELIGMKVQHDGERGAIALDASEIKDYVRGAAALVGIPFAPKTAGDKDSAPGSEDAVEKAKKKLSQTTYRTTLLDTLKKIGLDGSEDSLAAVVGLLGDKEAAIREKALAVIAPMGAKLRPFWKSIFALSTHEETRKQAQELLLEMGSGLTKDVYGYVLSSRDPKEMKAGVELLRQLGTKAGAKVYLNRIAENAERAYPPDIRSAARDAIRMIKD